MRKITPAKKSRLRTDPPVWSSTAVRLRGRECGAAELTMPRKSIKVNEETFEQLKDEKPDGVTWGYYLLEIRTPGETAEA